MTDPGVYKLV